MDGLSADRLVFADSVSQMIFLGNSGYLFKAGYIGLLNDTKGYNEIRLECSSSLEMVARVLLIMVNEAPK